MDVVVVGSCNMDLITYVKRLPRLGETIIGTKFEMGYGGKGANQCVMAAKLGAKVAMVAKVGDDVFGHNYLQYFKDINIPTDNVTMATDGSSTGVAPISADEDSNNSIVIVCGANLLLDETDLERATEVIKSSKVMVCQMEIQPKITLAAMKLAKKFGVKTLFNAAPAYSGIDHELLTTCDILCPNETEAETITGLPVTNQTEAETALQKLLDMGCNTVVMTLGSKGVIFASQENRVVTCVSARKVEAVDTTGAGDAFCGALAFYLATMPELEMAEVLRRSCELATISVMAPGTQKSFKWRNELPPELF